MKTLRPIFVGLAVLALTAITALLVGLLSGLRSSRAAVANDRGSERYFAPGFNVRAGVIAMQMALSTLLHRNPRSQSQTA